MEVNYKSHPTEVSTIEGRVGGKYRGFSWRVKIPQIIRVDEPSIDLTYRSLPYRSAVLVGVNESVKAAAVNPAILSEQSVNQPVIKH